MASLNLEEIDRSMSFHPSEACVVSCGTVTIDPAASKVLLIWNRHLKIHQLPKGRKNIDEDMLSAALRETYEETGVRAIPLRLKIATRATPPSDEDVILDEEGCDAASSSASSSTSSSPSSSSSLPSPSSPLSSPTTTTTTTTTTGPEEAAAAAAVAAAAATTKTEVTEDRLCTEFIGCCRYPDPQSSTPAEKVVFYYAAIADSTRPRGLGTPEDLKKLREVWTPASEAPKRLRFKAEAEIVRKALKDARRSGYPMAG